MCAQARPTNVMHSSSFSITSDDVGHRGASLSERLTDPLILTDYLSSLACQSVASANSGELFRRTHNLNLY